MHAGGADLVFEADPVVGDVFGAEPDGVGTAQAGDFHDAWLGEVEFEGDGDIAGAEFAQETTWAGFHKGMGSGLGKSGGIQRGKMDD